VGPGDESREGKGGGRGGKGSGGEGKGAKGIFDKLFKYEEKWEWEKRHCCLE